MVLLMRRWEICAVSPAREDPARCTNTGRGEGSIHDGIAMVWQELSCPKQPRLVLEDRTLLPRTSLANEGVEGRFRAAVLKFFTPGPDNEDSIERETNEKQ